jgi:hypothetical protein
MPGLPPPTTQLCVPSIEVLDYEASDHHHQSIFRNEKDFHHKNLYYNSMHTIPTYERHQAHLREYYEKLNISAVRRHSS